VPFRPIQREDKRRLDCQQSDQQTRQIKSGQLEEAKKSLQAFVIGGDQSGRVKRACQLRQVHRARLNQSDQQSRQQFDAGFVPSYISKQSALYSAYLNSHRVRSSLVEFDSQLQGYDTSGCLFNFQRSKTVLHLGLSLSAHRRAKPEKTLFA
jgi:hypothetical protein